MAQTWEAWLWGSQERHKGGIKMIDFLNTMVIGDFRIMHIFLTLTGIFGIVVIVALIVDFMQFLQAR